MATSPDHFEAMAQAPAPQAGKPSITADPAFPWIVALWFAALLGIGSLIVPLALLERVVLAAGLASVLPMAAPPLGFTAQALVALIGTAFGALLGLTLAKRLARPKHKQIGPSTDTARKPLDPSQDIGEYDIDNHDAFPLPSGRRRALAVTEEEGPSDYLNVAPLPGASEEPHDADAPAMEEEYALVEEIQEVDESVEPEAATPRQEFVADTSPRDEPVQELEQDTGEAQEPLDLDSDLELIDGEPASQQVETVQDERQDFIAAGHSARPVIEVDYRKAVEAHATAGEPLSFSPPSMARRDEGDNNSDSMIDTPIDHAHERQFAPENKFGEESEDSVSDKQIFEASSHPVDDVDNEHFLSDAHENPSSPCATDGAEEAEVQSDGLVQLVQRLGSTLEKHREWSAEKAANKNVTAPLAIELAERTGDGESNAEVAEAPVPDEFDTAAAEEAAQAMAAYFGNSAKGQEAQSEPLAFEPETGPQNAPETLEVAESSARPGFGISSGQNHEGSRQRYGALTGIAAAMGEEENEDEEIAELAASFKLPLTSESEPEPTPRPAFDQPPPSTAASTEEADEESDTDDEAREHTSTDLADVAHINPFRRDADEYVRIDEPEPEEGSAEPAVLFPNQASRTATAPASRAFDPPPAQGSAAPTQRAERPKPSNDDNERALREALMNLQRMGK